MNAYLDTSVVVSMLTIDGHTASVVRWLAATGDRVVLSDWTKAEFSSAVAMAMRVGRLTSAGRDSAELALDSWVSGREVLSLTATDVDAARTFVRSGARPVRAPDAFHLAIALRTGCSLATLDNGMAAAATDLGIPVEAI